jgi:hypothetical protein
MTPEAFRDYLRIVDAFPLAVPFHVIELTSCILIADSRDEATTVIMEAVASQYGEVIVTESIPSAHSDRASILGCLVKPSGDIEDAVDSLRAAYAIATSEATGDEGPI